MDDTQPLLAPMREQVTQTEAGNLAEKLTLARNSTIKAAIKTACPYEDTHFHESARKALEITRRQLGVSHADIMACELSKEMALNGDWNTAWECVQGVYEGVMSRDEWEAWLRETLLHKAKKVHCLMPL